MRALRRLLALLMLAGFCLPASARVIRSTLWISGGADNLLMGGDDAPGWLSLSAHIAAEGGNSCWIDAGGGAGLACLRQSPALRRPDIIIPGEKFLQTHSFAFLREKDLPWTLLNAGVLPQFPTATLPVETSRVWQQADGLRIRGTGLLAESAPRRIPTPMLQPLRVLSHAESLAQALPLWRKEAPALPVLVLPDGTSPEDAKLYPDFPVLIQRASNRPEVTALDGGKRLRVTPAANGRAVIRVDIAWDNVSHQFEAPRAEIVWVRAADPSTLALPDCALPHLRPAQPPAQTLENLLLQESELLLLPPVPASSKTTSRLPDALRAALVPVDQRWLRVHVPANTLRIWMERDISPSRWVGTPNTGRDTRLLLPSALSEDLQKQLPELRAFLQEPDTRVEILPLTSRERLVPLPAK